MSRVAQYMLLFEHSVCITIRTKSIYFADKKVQNTYRTYKHLHLLEKNWCSDNNATFSNVNPNALASGWKSLYKKIREKYVQNRKKCKKRMLCITAWKKNVQSWVYAVDGLYVFLIVLYVFVQFCIYFALKHFWKKSSSAWIWCNIVGVCAFFCKRSNFRSWNIFEINNFKAKITPNFSNCRYESIFLRPIVSRNNW